MKKLFTILTVAFLATGVLAQSPQKMSYQAVLRNSGNTLITNTQVGMQISILQGSPNGTSVYIESQSPTSNANGLVSLEIGSGTVLKGTFSNIDWANGPYFIKTETDPSGGTSYTITGSSELLSVPYALYAANSAAGPAGPQGPQGLTGPQGAKGDTGSAGPQGIQGVPGATGSQGNTGPAGAPGLQGNTGAQGPQGNVGLTGPQGPQGIQGPQGLPGVQGNAGPIGPQGIQGLTGATGATGAQGPIGLTGPQGNTGPQGPQGIQGLPGNNGVDGATGPQGPIGNTGPQGAQGVQGIPGNDGMDGAPGATGPQGDIGLTGPQGPQGIQGNVGATGPQGEIGLTGPQGPQGIPGNVGATGPQGPIGLTGAPGNQGIPGPIGPQGLQGPQGNPGAQGPAGSDASITMGAIGGSSTNGGEINSGVLTLAPASTTNGGVVTTTLQNFAGDKTFSGKVAIGTTSQNVQSSLEIATPLPVIFPSMSQTQINALTPVEGMVQFNADAHKLQIYSLLTDNAQILNEIFVGTDSGPGAFIIDQSITAPISGQVIAVEVMLKDDGPNFPIDFIGQGTYTLPSYAQFTWHTFILTSPVTVFAGGPYNFAFIGIGVDFRRFAVNSNYPNGSGCCFPGGDDVLFRVHIQPLPGSYGWQNMH